MAHPVDHISDHFDISPEMEHTLRSMMSERRFSRGEKILGRHELQSIAFYIRKGSARAYYLHTGREHTYSFAFDDEFVSVPMSLLKTPDATVAIEFLESTDVIFMPVTDMRTLIQDFGNEHMAEVASYIISILFEHSQLIEERLLVFQSMSAPERYQWLINMYPAILERATITQIASFLGVTKETLYRIRAGKY